MLSFKPWQVYSGSLNLVQLAAVIKYAVLHLSGDTGPMHIAVMTETPSISWFQPTISLDWIPQGDSHKVLFGLNDSFYRNIQGVTPDLIFNEIPNLLHNS